MDPGFELEIDVGQQGVIDEQLVVESLAGTDALPERALADFRKAARGEPGDPDYAYILGNALAHRGNHADAVAAFREAIALDRAQPLYHASLGVALWRLDRSTMRSTPSRTPSSWLRPTPRRSTGSGSPCWGRGARPKR